MVDLRILIAVFLLFSACASRKTNTDITRLSSNNERLEDIRLSIKDDIKSLSENKVESKNDIKQLETSIIVNTKFDASGNKIEETITTTTKDLTDKSTRIEIITIYFTRNITLSYVKTLKIKETITVKLKTKQTSTISVYAYLFWILFVFNAIYFGFKALRN